MLYLSLLATYAIPPSPLHQTLFLKSPSTWFPASPNVSSRGSTWLTQVGIPMQRCTSVLHGGRFSLVASCRPTDQSGLEVRVLLVLMVVVP